MDEDNDDQWLYGEDPVAEKSATNKTDECSDAPVNSINPPEPTEGHESEASPYKSSNLEPPIIDPPEAQSFSETDVVPGEEEMLVPLDPPVINAPEISEKECRENNEENEHLANGEATAATTEEGGKKSKSGAKLSEGEEEDDEDDNIDVVIGDIRTTPNYNANLHIKRQNLLTLTKVYHYRPNYYPQQPNQQTGTKFAADDFESVGIINGVPAHEFNLDNLEDKPWRKPGADITDYFNYGFNEDTWRAYCERQKRIRVHESGSGLIPMNQAANVNIIPNVNVPPPNMMASMGLPDVNPGSINVIGGANSRRSGDAFAKENTIQVMTADRREYSKKNFTPDMSVPPPIVPPFGALPPGIPPPFPMSQYGPPPGDYFPPEMDPYYHSYESQDANWPGQSWNANIDVKNMISLSNGGQRSLNGTPSAKGNADGPVGGVKIKTEPEDRDSTHERDRERGKSRDYDRDRDRESRHRDRSHRHRSRSRSHERRSRKHKSRSRSPSYRSHKKKKSKKSERSKSDSD